MCVREYRCVYIEWARSLWFSWAWSIREGETLFSLRSSLFSLLFPLSSALLATLRCWSRGRDPSQNPCQRPTIDASGSHLINNPPTMRVHSGSQLINDSEGITMASAAVYEGLLILWSKPTASIHTITIYTHLTRRSIDLAIYRSIGFPDNNYVQTLYHLRYEWRFMTIWKIVKLLYFSKILFRHFLTYVLAMCMIQPGSGNVIVRGATRGGSTESCYI